jgi:hypothetical protein
MEGKGVLDDFTAGDYALYLHGWNSFRGLQHC